MLRKSKWWTQLGRGGACDHVPATRLQQRDVMYETSSRTSLEVQVRRNRNIKKKIDNSHGGGGA